MSSTVSGVLWKANYGEVSDNAKFRVGKISPDTWDATFPIAQLGDLVTLLSAANALPVDVVQKTTTLQLRKVYAGFFTDVIVEPRLDTGTPAEILRFGMSELPDLLYVTQLLATDLQNKFPDDWDFSDLPKALAFNKYGELTDPAAKQLLHDAVLAVGPTVNDPVVAGLIADETSATAAQLSATIDGVVTPVRKREQSAAARAYPRQIRPFALPAGLGYDPGIPIFFDGEKYTTPFDVASKKPAGGTTRYVKSTGSNSTGDGTAGNPWKGLAYAIDNSAAGDTIVVQNAITYRGDLFVSGAATSKSISVVAESPRSVLAVADALSYTATSGQAGVYQAARTNVTRVVDISIGPSYLEYTKLTSVAAVQAQEGSWYTDGTTLYVHQIGGGAPTNTRILALLLDERFSFASGAGSVTNYFEGFDFLGSSRNVRAFKGGTGDIRAYFKNCRFLYGCAPSGTYGNALNVHGAIEVITQGCLAAYPANDGYNYHTEETNGGLPRFAEINCEAHSCGIWDTTVTLTQNASTAHDGSRGLRIGGKYHYTYGSVVADVHANTKTVNLSIDVWDSLAPSGMYNAGISAQQADTEMWVFGCRVWGTENDLYSFAGATLRATDTQLDTFGGTGTLSIVGPR